MSAERNRKLVTVLGVVDWVEVEERWSS